LPQPETAAATSPPQGSFDPLAEGAAFEEAAIPFIEITPAARRRKNSSTQLLLAMRGVSSATTVEAAALALAERLGEPSWTEAPQSSPLAKRRVWAVDDSPEECHRLILEPDGALVVEIASRNDPRTLTLTTRLNPCTGEIERRPIE
jgi:hypothetical protein